jgi:2-succinyl-6-hydroxy-2,4-cyclohexadiene-1-carboxylate synthase
MNTWDSIIHYDMKTEFQSFTINSDILRPGKSGEYIFFLHGFTGSLKDWKPAAENIQEDFNVVGIDVIGHGQSDSPGDSSLYSAAAISSQLDKVIRSYTTGKVILAGYSMGGRAALAFAVNFPYMLKGLVLESCNPGLESMQEREERIKRDDEVIQLIAGRSIEEFTDFWMNLEVFNTQRRFSKEKRNAIRESKLINNKTGLINSLKEFGSGVMPSYRKCLPELNINTLVISGELDTKYTKICTGMAALLPHCKHVIINSAGHNTHLEEPAKYLTALNEFLSVI